MTRVVTTEPADMAGFFVVRNSAERKLPRCLARLSQSISLTASARAEGRAIERGATDWDEPMAA